MIDPPPRTKMYLIYVYVLVSECVHALGKILLSNIIKSEQYSQNIKNIVKKIFVLRHKTHSIVLAIFDGGDWIRCWYLLIIHLGLVLGTAFKHNA